MSAEEQSAQSQSSESQATGSQASEVEEPGPQSVTGPRTNVGLVIVNTGKGKGKTNHNTGCNLLYRV